MTNHDGLAWLLVAALRAPILLLDHEPSTQKPCSRCGRALPLESYSREARANDGRRADCRVCARLARRGLSAGESVESAVAGRESGGFLS